MLSLTYSRLFYTSRELQEAIRICDPFWYVPVNWSRVLKVKHIPYSRSRKRV